MFVKLHQKLTQSQSEQRHHLAHLQSREKAKHVKPIFFVFTAKVKSQMRS